MKKAWIGIILGTIAGMIDIIPMILQKMSWDANLSAFFHWIILGYLISITNLKINGPIKGLFLSILTMIPISFLVWWKNTNAIIPMTISTIIFGLLLGYLIEKFKSS